MARMWGYKEIKTEQVTKLPLSDLSYDSKKEAIRFVENNSGFILVFWEFSITNSRWNNHYELAVMRPKRKIKDPDGCLKSYEIKDLRISLNISAKELAKSINVSLKYYKDIERGKVSAVNIRLMATNYLKKQGGSFEK